MPRVRVCVATGELEVEGDVSFVSKYEADIRAAIDRLASGKVVPAAGQAKQEGSPEIPGAFGEVLHGLPKSATGVDQILLAGHFVQESNAEKTFSTKEANALLVEQGIKLGNPSQSLKNNLTAKRVFKVGSRYRVSKPGEDHLATLMKS